MNSESLYLYIISQLPIKNLKLLEDWRSKAGSFENFYNASSELLYEYGLPRQLHNTWIKIKQEMNIEELFDLLIRKEVATLPYYDERYPKLLREIYDPPAVLFYRGNLLDADEANVAIVGSRLMSVYGKAILPRITEPLITSGVTIVSGLAYGIDAAAHTQAVKAGARTIAVLGSGVDDDSIYPRAHLNLSEQILQNNGLIISEYPPKSIAFKHHFIARNRIIAGISIGVCVIECKNKSGALITADYAMDFGRPVYAVPGPINSALSEGPNQLIKSGATPITTGEDVLIDLNLKVTEKISPTMELTEPQKLVLKCMHSEPATIEDLVNRTKLNLSDIISSLSFLELKGHIVNAGVEGYIKT